MPTLVQFENSANHQTVVSPSDPLPVTIISGGGASSDVNLLTIAGVTPSVGNGTSGTGTLRVTIASDSTGSLAVTQSGSWIVDTELPTAVAVADDLVPSDSPYIQSLLYGYQTASGNWDRLRLTGDNSDAIGTAGTGHLQTLAHGMMYNGTTWDRVRGSITDGLLVNLGANNDVTQSGTWNITNISGTISLPTGAATESTLSTLNGKVPSGLTVTSTRLLVDGSGVTQPVSGSISVTNLNLYTEGDTDTTITGYAALFEGPSNTLTPPKLDSTQRLEIALERLGGSTVTTGTGTSVNTLRTVIANDTDWKPHIQDSAGNNIVLGQATMSNSLPVVIASNQSTIPFDIAKSSTATLSNVAGSATSVTLLSSNSNRLGATFYNDSTAILYLKFGTTASTTSFTVKLLADDYYELPNPNLYTGRIDGIWASATGSCRVTELT